MSMMVMEETYGLEQVRRFYNYEMNLYLAARRVAPLVPLIDAVDQQYLYYHKGALAMYTLREHLGADAINSALRGFLTKRRDAGPPFPTSRDLYAELEAVTPDSLTYLLSDLFERITFWNVGAREARAVETAAGEYLVSLDIDARKVVWDSTGNETEVPMNDLVEIGIFGEGEERLGEPLYLERHRIESGERTIEITVPRRPARAGIDPYRKLISREPRDNVVDVEIDPGP